MIPKYLPAFILIAIGFGFAGRAVSYVAAGSSGAAGAAFIVAGVALFMAFITTIYATTKQ